MNKIVIILKNILENFKNKYFYEIKMFSYFLILMSLPYFSWAGSFYIAPTKGELSEDSKYIVIRDDETTKTNLLGYLNLPKFFGGTLKARIVEETNGIVVDDHMGEFGHKNQAEYFYNHIIKNIK
jgi:hypothetical protein